MERIRTIVRIIKKSEKRIFYNIEDFCSAFGISSEVWIKCRNRFYKNVQGQQHWGFFALYEFWLSNQYTEKIQGATGEWENFYCTKSFIQEVLRLKAEDVEEVF